MNFCIFKPGLHIYMYWCANYSCTLKFWTFGPVDYRVKSEFLVTKRIYYLTKRSVSQLSEVDITLTVKVAPKAFIPAIATMS